MYTRCLAAVAAASLMAGCAIHPVPENVTGLRTEDIVKQIRCETRDAVRKVILDKLKFLGESDPKARLIFEKYNANPDQLGNLNPDREFAGSFYDLTRNYFKLIYGAGTAYTFDLTMTETNDIGSTSNFLGSWQASLALNLVGDLNRTRVNRRTFTITDNFQFLLRDLNSIAPDTGRSYCDGQVAFGPNYIYPIAGEVGMYNPVRTFLQLSVFENLGAANKDLSKITKVDDTGAPAMVEDLTFTTVVDLMPSPKFTFVQVKRGFEITDTAAKGNFSRTDKHQLTVGFALEPSANAALTVLRGLVFTGPTAAARQVAADRRGTPTSVLNSVIASPKSKAELIALYAVDQRKSTELQLRVAP